LHGRPIDDLRLYVSKPYDPPKTYDDGAHPAIDLYYDGIEGTPLFSILAGRVSTLINDTYPYGNAIIIETPLDQNSNFADDLTIFPTPIPTITFNGDTVCGGQQFGEVFSSNELSLYTLYAHLQDTPTLTIRQAIQCGQSIDRIGTTGNSAIAHVHIEMRVGPSDARFGTIGNYLENTTGLERYNYCIWYRSGIFQSIDPMKILLYEEPAP
jgi:murein DD-endopeptidase MepM/ murein hydrolase activator NlpD